MKISTILIAALVSVASAQKSFGLVAVRSGSPIQNSPITVVDNKFGITSGSGSTFDLVDGILSLSGKPDSYFTVNSDKTVSSTSSKDTQFVNENGYLGYKDTQGFTAIPNSDKTSWSLLYTGNGNGTVPDGAYTVALRIFAQTNSTNSTGSGSTSPPAHTTLAQVNGAKETLINLGGVVIAAVAVALF